MIKVAVKSGRCDQETNIFLIQRKNMKIGVDLQSTCLHMQSMGQELRSVDAYDECFRDREYSKVLKLASRHCKHTGCPVPMAICQGVEAAAGISETNNTEVIISNE